jgi:hypothetical protein
VQQLLSVLVPQHVPKPDAYGIMSVRQFALRWLPSHHTPSVFYVAEIVKYAHAICTRPLSTHYVTRSNSLDAIVHISVAVVGRASNELPVAWGGL